MCREVTSCWIKEYSNSSTGGSLSTRDKRAAVESAYKKKMEAMLNDDNLFEVFIVSLLVAVNPY